MTPDEYSIETSFLAAVDQLDQSIATDANRFVEMLFEDLLDITNPSKEGSLTQTQWQVLQSSLKRLNEGEPLQYVCGIAHFYGLKFEVNGSTLIPRSETEELVQAVLNQLPESLESTIDVLDIGTGSGCIAITIKHRRPDVAVVAMDNNRKALEVAERNREKHQVNVQMCFEDITNCQSDLIKEGKWDFIVSNPPYIQLSERNIMDEQVLKYEPASALFPPGDDPVQMYFIILNYAKTHLRDAGFLFLELNEFLAFEIKAMAIRQGFTEVQLIYDLQGKPRILKARRP